jgi:hypothetical protein
MTNKKFDKRPPDLLIMAASNYRSARIHYVWECDRQVLE